MTKTTFRAFDDEEPRPEGNPGGREGAKPEELEVDPDVIKYVGGIGLQAELTPGGWSRQAMHAGHIALGRAMPQFNAFMPPLGRPRNS